jgi:hypothetical protein
VEAAESIDAGVSRRSSTAKIAAATGLTRIEVSQLRRAKSNSTLKEAAPLNRAIRVAIAWGADQEFKVDRKKPLCLPFAGPGPSFTGLVRKYGGDIPARAMLAEMRRLGMVKEMMNGLIELVSRKTRAVKPAVAAIRAISPWVNFLSNAGGGGSNEGLTSTARQLKIHFESLPQVYAAVRELESRRTSFVTGLELLGTRSKRSAEYELTISVAVAAAKPLRAKKEI